MAIQLPKSTLVGWQACCPAIATYLNGGYTRLFRTGATVVGRKA
jgi:hypothetical protein